MKKSKSSTVQRKKNATSTRSNGALKKVDFALTESADILKAAGHPLRLQILQMLSSAKPDLCACEFEKAMPIKQPTVSHHLKILREAGLVESEKNGLWMHYSITKKYRKFIQGLLKLKA